MIIEYEIKIPDYPYTSDTNLGKSISVKYDGDRYHAFVFEKSTFKFIKPFFSWSPDDDSQSLQDTLQDPRLPKFKDFENEHEIIEIFDANDFPLEISYVTGKYHFNSPQHYEETLVDGSTWTYNIWRLNEIFSTEEIFYDPKQRKFSEFSYRLHPLTPERFWENQSLLISLLKEDIELLKQDGQDTELEENYLKTLEDKMELFKDTDHWKIPPNFGVTLPERDQESLP